MPIMLVLIIQTFITYGTLKFYIDSKNIALKEVIIFILYLVNNIFVFQLFGNIGMIGQTLFLFLIAWHVQKDWKLGLASLSITMISNILADHLATAILSAILQAHVLEESSMITHFVFLSLYFILTFVIILLSKCFFKRNQPLLSSHNGKNLFTLSVTSIFVIFELNIAFELISGNKKNMVELNLLFFTILLLFSIISIASYTQSIRRNYLMEQQKLEFEVLKIYTSNLEQHYSDIRKFRHDYQNILTSLEGYLVEKDYRNLENYFYKNIKPTSKQIKLNDFALRDLSNIKIAPIKSLLTSKVALAQEKHIGVSIEITEPIEKIELPLISLVRILGIVLDNAIEGVEHLPKKELCIAFIKDKTSIHIIVENTCSTTLPKLHQLKKKGFSTKGANRGLGLNNLQELINATSNSILLTKIEHGRFNQTITIINN